VDEKGEGAGSYRKRAKIGKVPVVVLGSNIERIRVVRLGSVEGIDKIAKNPGEKDKKDSSHAR